MKVVILAGGRGTRISEESMFRPKPMIEIGGKPILWHIMKLYSHYGFYEFVICCGYKGQMIKEYFVNYAMYQSDISFQLAVQKQISFKGCREPWKVTLVNTGLDTLTAGRLLRVREYLPEEEFMLTYGDGVSDVDIPKLIEAHHNSGRMATITVTKPVGRFGALQIDPKTDEVLSFAEKARADQSWVNAGFMVMNRKIFDYLGDGSEMLEPGPFVRLAEAREMNAYRHNGFWSPMDNIRDHDYLEELWNRGKAPWEIWKR